jgi:NSS family neurotransmitter:Na+ symporter
MGMAITSAVYMRKAEDTVLNAFTMGLANNSISIIAGLAVLSSIFAVSSDPLATVTGGSSAITFLALPEVFAQAPGGPTGALIMVAMFFLALTFAALTSMISTIEMCVRNFVDHGFSRDKAVGATAIAIFILGIPSAVIAIKTDAASGVMFPEFLEVQDHINPYPQM